MTGVHRSELTPVAFLQRAAYLHPARVAVAHEDGRRITYGELEERCHRLANALRARGLRHGERVAVLSPNAPAILEAHYAVPLAGGVLVAINTRLGAGRGRPHPAPLRRPGAARRSRARAARRGTRPERHRRRADRRQRPAGRCLRAADRVRRARAARVVARARGGADLDQLHVGHDGRAQGRRLHAPRRVPERARRGDRGRPDARERVPLDAADVPLQRLVLPVGGHRGRRAPRDRARGRSRSRVGADRARGRDALQRRADGAHRRRGASVGAPAGARGDRARRGGAALADAARAARGAQLPRGARLRSHRDLRADHREPRARWIRRSGRGRPRARARPAGPGVPDRRPRARRRRGRRRRAARRRRRWARS